jgi:pimeloyl-ACP methyl ester carboxylesterase
MYFEVDGVRSYAYTGSRPFDPTQRSVVFIHGAGLDHTVWLLQSRYFAHHGFNAVALDLPGHGRSAGAPLPGIAAMARWVNRATDTLGIEHFASIGHSMGALVAMQAAADAPQRVVLAGLLGIAVPMPVSEELLQAARSNDHSAFDMVNLWGHGYASQLGGNTAPGMWMVGSANRLLERGGSGVLFNDLNACNEYGAGLEAAAMLHCPALVLLGKQDIMASPRAARELIAALARASVHELDGCGHMLMAEQPDAVLDALFSACTDAFGSLAADPAGC